MSWLISFYREFKPQIFVRIYINSCKHSPGLQSWLRIFFRCDARHVLMWYGSEVKYSFLNSNPPGIAGKSPQNVEAEPKRTRTWTEKPARGGQIIRKTGGEIGDFAVDFIGVRHSSSPRSSYDTNQVLVVSKSQNG